MKGVGCRVLGVGCRVKGVGETFSPVFSAPSKSNYQNKPSVEPVIRVHGGLSRHGLYFLGIFQLLGTISIFRNKCNIFPAFRHECPTFRHEFPTFRYDFKFQQTMLIPALALSDNFRAVLQNSARATRRVAVFDRFASLRLTGPLRNDTGKPCS